MTKKKWMKIFASRVNSRMNLLCINQKELAEDTGISRTTIHRYLNGKQMPKIDAIINISKVLEYHVSELVDVGEMIHWYF